MRLLFALLLGIGLSCHSKENKKTETKKENTTN